MNIFVLSENPILAANLHCDQHMHKMILESAQMLSMAWHQCGMTGNSWVYRKNQSSHNKHPCTQWAASSLNNMLWLADLATQLEEVRQIAEPRAEHASTPVVASVREHLQFAGADSRYAGGFIYAGITLLPPGNDSIVSKYHRLYKLKQRQWQLTDHPMTYEGRDIPRFLSAKEQS